MFLDIDGVLNHETFYENYSVEYRQAERERLNDEWGDVFCPKSTEYINNVIKETQCKVVISSSKRFIEGDRAYMNSMWKNRGFIGEIIGITPFLTFKQNTDSSVSRGEEIKHWLSKHKFSNIDWSKEDQLEKMLQSNISNYIIIDDDSDMLYIQRNHFIHIQDTKYRSGFDEYFMNLSIEKLNKTAVELNYNEN